MRALDLFCKAGGASMGLHQAGFDVTGVDIEPQPRYPFRFYQGDAITVLNTLSRGINFFDDDGIDFIWASPPCQAYSIAAQVERANGKDYPELIEATRKRLNFLGVPYVIENVPSAPIRCDLILCGSHFGLPIVRHRHFECSFQTFLSPSCAHAENPITVCGHGTPQWMRQSRIRKGLYPNVSVEQKRDAMGIDWMNRGELAQAVPPAYSKFIGEAAMKHILSTRTAATAHD